jgi:CDP-diacylglycerol--glycerol-3-phosphate 3-phosphatidyltransferase
MPTIYALKPEFQNLLRPTMNGLARSGITPNQVTIAAAVMSIGAGAWIAWAPRGHTLLLLPVVLLVRMALNALDGMLAREHNQTTRVGNFLNEFGDVVSDAALYLPLACVAGFTPPFVVVVVLLAMLAEMAGVLGLALAASRRYDGPLGKSDRAFIFATLGSLLGFGLRVEPAIPYVLCGMMLLLVCTVINRTQGALRESALNGGSK